MSNQSSGFTIPSIKQKSYAVAIIAYPLMLMTGFLLHPNLLAMERLQTAQQLVDRFHHNPAYHLGHLIVTFAVPVIILYMVATMSRLQTSGYRWGFWGGVFGVFGAFILAVDKGALCLVLSAFDTLPESEFQSLVPHLQVIVDKAGLLKIVVLLAFLVIGGVLQTIGLLKERIIKAWQGVFIIVGLLLIVPDIDLIAAIGTAMIFAASIPWGIKEFSRDVSQLHRT